MEWTFVGKAGRGIDVDLGPGYSALTEALADGVSSMPPRSAQEQGLSTYWIDHVLNGMAWVGSGTHVLTSGNVTELVLEDQVVIARSLYELFDDQRIDRETFAEILREWRSEVVQRADEYRIAETYRRNGFE
jgi:hypothetical protein